jgi:SHS2 domain-containing protein
MYLNTSDGFSPTYAPCEIGISMKKRFEFLEHTADAYVAAYGDTLEEAFENAALATFEVMTDLETVDLTIEEELEVQAHDEYALLYRWIEELLIRFETKGRLYARFKILGIETLPQGFRLKAKAGGELYDPKKHPQKVGIKAITYHQMKIIKTDGKVTLEFILDI